MAAFRCIHGWWVYSTISALFTSFQLFFSDFSLFPRYIPSGKRLHNYGKSPCSMGKSTISMAIFNSYVSHYQRLNESSQILRVLIHLGHTKKPMSSAAMRMDRTRPSNISSGRAQLPSMAESFRHLLLGGWVLPLWKIWKSVGMIIPKDVSQITRLSTTLRITIR